MKTIKVGSDFSGVGAFDYALKSLNIDYETVFACDMDKYARKSFIAAHGEPKYYPVNVYDREIPKDSLDIYMTSPPCQAFSIAGNRKGKEDERGILFFNSHEFIKENKPRFFIFENVKGLLSDDNGNTFNEWVNMLGGKSVNGLPILFPYEDSVPYHIYWKVLNAKNHGVPQNRERVFIVGIRDDSDNSFTWPKEIPLTKKLKDVLEIEVDEKYFLSDKMVSQLIENGTETNHLLPGEYSKTIRCGGSGSLTEKHNFDMIKVVGNTNPSGNGMNGNVFDENGISPTLSTNKGEGIKIKSATKKGNETATENDSINFSVPNSETRRGRVGKEVAQTLDTQCNKGISTNNLFNTDKNINFDGILKSIDNEKRNTAEILLMLQQEIGKTAIETWRLRVLEIIRKKTLLRQGVYEESIYSKRKETTGGTFDKIQQAKSVEINAYVVMRGLPKESWERCSPQRRKSIKQLIRKLNESLQKLSYENTQTDRIMQSRELQYESKRIGLLRETLSEIQEIQQSVNKQIQRSRIRRLTPTEAFRLMGFPDSHVEKCKDAGVSDSQLYKQAGNSIVVDVLAQIINKFKL